MQLVIEMSDDDYERIKDMPDAFNSLTSRAYRAIKNGKPLPKGHDELIERRELNKCIQPLLDDKSIPLSNASEISYNMDCIPIVLEADKEN